MIAEWIRRPRLLLRDTRMWLTLHLQRFPRTLTSRTLFFATGDVGLWLLGYYLSFLVRFDGRIPSEFIAAMPVTLILIIPVKLVWHALFKLYQVTWRQVGLKEIMQVGKASTIASLTLAGALFLLRDTPAFGAFPRSILVLDYLLGTGFVGVFRLLRRLLDELAAGRSGAKDGTPVLLVGAGAAGERIARSLMNGAGSKGRRLVGFIDDDRAKHGTYIQGLKVFGGREAIPVVVKSLDIEEVVITIPTAPAAAVREIVRYTREAGVKRIKVVPSINEVLAGRASLHQIRDVDVEDLLGRELVRLDPDRVSTFLAGRTVLVTGAGGSIGAELSRQLSRAGADRLILLDNNETALFELELELLREESTSNVSIVIADVRDADKIHRLFAAWKPDVIYHAAAYKHVPLMETHADEATRTNVFGTLTVGEAALRHGGHTCVLISSDKAVKPSSVMGSSKRVAELIINALNGRGATRFMAVRFGNVIGSRGSVIPVMQEQIRRGGPVTVTHPEMTRYFMSTREAAALVLQASAMKDPHDIFMLDMGQPVRILELAQELIRLSGFEPDKDIPIVFTGMRPGEKLHEVLETSEEPLEATGVPKIFAVKTNGRVDEVTLRLALQELDRLSRALDMNGVRSILQRLTASSGSIPLWSTVRQ